MDVLTGRGLKKSAATVSAVLMRRMASQGLATLAALADCLTWQPHAPPQVLPRYSCHDKHHGHATLSLSSSRKDQRAATCSRRVTLAHQPT